jgi:hypothetical protein
VLQFPHITRLAEGLSVRSLIQSAAHDRDYVIEHEVFCAVTPSAFRVIPIGLLPRGKANAVTLLLSRLRIMLESRKHQVSINAPSLFESGRHLGASFRRVLVSFLGSRSLTWSRSGTLRLLHAFESFWTMVLAPEGIIGTSHRDADAFPFAASDCDAPFKVGGSAINQFSADFARNILSCFLVRHGYLGKIGLIR